MQRELIPESPVRSTSAATCNQIEQTPSLAFFGKLKIRLVCQRTADSGFLGKKCYSPLREKREEKKPTKNRKDLFNEENWCPQRNVFKLFMRILPLRIYRPVIRNPQWYYIRTVCTMDSDTIVNRSKPQCKYAKTNWQQSIPRMINFQRFWKGNVSD